MGGNGGHMVQRIEQLAVLKLQIFDPRRLLVQFVTQLRQKIPPALGHHGPCDAWIAWIAWAKGHNTLTLRDLHRSGTRKLPREVTIDISCHVLVLGVARQGPQRSDLSASWLAVKASMENIIKY